jgi:hypothetical protein
MVQERTTGVSEPQINVEISLVQHLGFWLSLHDSAHYCF